MDGTAIVEREWTFPVTIDEVQIRCRYRRQGKLILQYTVQLEIWRGNNWQPIIRYDNAHGFCHYDTIHADGSQDKTPVYRGDANANFTWAIDELRANWEFHQTRFLAEVRS
jgi:hypothetical protein